MPPISPPVASASDGYPRDLAGYGETPPHPRWPGEARIAVQFVLNYEEGAEASMLHGDPLSETFLSDIVGATPYPQRHMSMESLYEYGSRAGIWRVLRMFRERGVPFTLFGVAMALERNPAVVERVLADGHELACHGWRWISYQGMDESIERSHLARAVAAFERFTGRAPEGWYIGRDSPQTRRLLAQQHGLVYCADSYADDLPYWTEIPSTSGPLPMLMVPYTLDCNDMRFVTAQGFHTAEQFYAYLRDAFDVLYREGDPKGENAPRMLSIGLHARLIGRPGRISALERFLDHVHGHDHVWIARRIDIARHWIAAHPWRGAA